MDLPDPQKTPRRNGASGREPIVELTGVHLHLASAGGEVNILRGLDLSVTAGETIGVVGPSGSGKSTMVMIIAGLERPTSGTVRVAGNDLARLNEDALALFRRRSVGIVFQAFHLVPTMTAVENVAVPLEFARVADAFDRAQASLETVGLGNRLAHYPAQLSGGEQQRVAIARAFATEPALLLADEPTGNLDGETGEQVIDVLFEQAERNATTLLLITHDTTIARRCSRVVHLRDGRIVDESASP